MLELLNQSSVNETIKVISSKDTAIKNPDAYADYLQTLNEDLLGLEGQPTRFVLKLSNDLKSATASKNAQYSAAQKAKDGDVPLADIMLATVKYAMVGIDGEPIVKLTDLNWAVIVQQDILAELFTALEAKKTAITKATEEAKKS